MSGGILKAWTFEEFTGTARVAKMAKSRDAAKERYWRVMIRRFETSGLGLRRFCDREGLSEHRLYWWRRTLRQRDPCPSQRRGESGRRGRVHGGDGQPSESSFLPVGLPFSVVPSPSRPHFLCPPTDRACPGERQCGEQPVPDDDGLGLHGILLPAAQAGAQDARSPSDPAAELPGRHCRWVHTRGRSGRPA